MHYATCIPWVNCNIPLLINWQPGKITYASNKLPVTFHINMHCEHDTKIRDRKICLAKSSATAICHLPFGVCRLTFPLPFWPKHLAGFDTLHVREALTAYWLILWWTAAAKSKTFGQVIVSLISGWITQQKNNNNNTYVSGAMGFANAWFTKQSLYAFSFLFRLFSLFLLKSWSLVHRLAAAAGWEKKCLCCHTNNGWDLLDSVVFHIHQPHLCGLW